ncbi:MAG: homogentisate 1,2-dioxygenase [Elusimicrobia bacterium]|nr:homogentisate 1,2-dioxygenase [Elusimicrobiota bacterium]
MSVILTRGRVPKTPHTEFYSEPEVLALEEIHGVSGFSGDWSRKYHYRKYPTQQVSEPKRLPLDLRPQTMAPHQPLQPWHIRTGRLKAHGDHISGRVPLVYGATTLVSAARFQKSCPPQRFFRNGDGHELWFVQEGSGLIASEFGVLPFRKGHYVNIPKGTTYRVELESEDCALLIIESRLPIQFAPHYLNASGQAHLTSPVVETETGLPEFRPARDEEGEFRVWTKHDGGHVTELFLGHHPFDLIGWEGALYPYTFHTDDQHPVARQIHTAPPARQTFQSGTAPHNGFAVCTFKGQIEGWHPRDVPAPYAHYNVDSDEVMFFSNTSYGARKGLVEPGSFTFHPGSLPHSPHGMAAKRSFAERGKISDYLAVMLDTFFEPLAVAKQALPLADKDYPTSWNRDTQGISGA